MKAHTASKSTEFHPGTFRIKEELFESAYCQYQDSKLREQHEQESV
jgi:hypothetical protein